MQPSGSWRRSVKDRRWGAFWGIGDLDVVGKLTMMCNDIGLDTIEAGDVIGVAMEAGLAEFG